MSHKLNGKIFYTNPNDNPAFNNPRFITTVVIHTEKKMGRKLSQGEIRLITNFIRKIDHDVFVGVPLPKLLNNLVDAITRKISALSCDETPEDTHEMLKQEIGQTDESNVVHSLYDRADIPSQSEYSQGDMSQGGSQSISTLLGINNLFDFSKQINPAGLVRKNYFLLDSRYKSSESTRKKFTWNYINDKSVQQGTVNMIGSVRDVVAFRVYPFRIPYVEEADTKQKRVSILFEEFSSQSFLAHENRRFHFMADTTIDGSFINLDTEYQNDGRFDFEKPFTTFNSITVSFGSPLQLIEFQNDSDRCTIDYFGIAPLTQITTLSPHGLVNGDKVFFSNFTAGPINPILVEQVKINNIIINTINREAGFIITVIDPSNFSIAYDISNIQNPIPNLEFSVFYDSKRFYIPVEVSYLYPGEKNYV